MDADVLIETDRLFLRRVKAADEDLFLRLFCDAEMMRYLGTPWEPAQALETLQEWRSEWGKHNYCYGVMVQKKSRQAIGIAGFSEDTNSQESGIEFSWFVLPEYQKHSFASEITLAMMEYVFKVLKKDRLFAETHPDNAASNRVLEKMKFKNAGERSHKIDFLPDFDRQVLWEYSLTDWKNR